MFMLLIFIELNWIRVRGNTKLDLSWTYLDIIWCTLGSRSSWKRNIRL